MLKISQIEQYHQEGYLLASGLIPDTISKKAEKTLWSLLNMLPNQPQSWETIPAYAKVEPHRNLIDVTTTAPDLMACCTPKFIRATAQLLNEPAVETHRPTGINTINVFPTSEWFCGKAHIDGIELGGQKHRRTFPGPLRMVVLSFLSDTKSKGGGTLVWPKSHQRIRALAESNLQKYEYLLDLHNEVQSLDLGQPIELNPKRGDVLFFQHLFAHAGTANMRQTPRLAFRYLCTCRACEKWKHSPDWNLWAP